MALTSNERGLKKIGHLTELSLPSKSRFSLAICFVLFSCNAIAGGHFDVDDAATLDPGQCQYELWNTRSTGTTKNFLHLGPACRVGPVEAGLNYDRFSDAQGRFNLLGPQIKWMFLGSSESFLSAAVSVSASGDTSRSGKWSREIVFPVSVMIKKDLLIHANAGYDWAVFSGTRTGRLGAQVEWAMNDSFSLIAERNRAFDSLTNRVGVRYNLTPLISIDASAAHSNGPLKNTFVIGINHEFSR